MPSPIAHCSIAWLVWPGFGVQAVEHISRRSRRLLLGGLLFTLNAPDLDIAAGMVLGTGAFADHGGPTHSLLAGALWGVPFALAARRLIRVHPVRLWLLGTLAYWSHIVLDMGTVGRGQMAFWPFSPQRFSWPVQLFFGVQHSSPLGWPYHLATVATELIFAGLVWWCARRVIRPRLRRHRSTMVAPAPNLEQS